MADNVQLDSGSGGVVLAADEISAVQYQRIKLISGADGVNDGDVASGNPLPVDIIAALPAGTAAIGKLAANSGTDIGDVDVTSLIPGGGATQLGKAEDAAHTTGDTGVAVLTVRRDTAAVGSDTDGDYSTLNVGSTGRLWCSATIDAALPAGTNEIGKLAANSGTDIGDVDVTSVLPGTGALNLGKIEDAGHTTGDVGVMSLAVRLDSGASLVDTDGDYAPLQVDSAGALRVTGGGGGTEYSEDIGTPATIVGTASMMERDDVIATLTPAAGDWAAFRCSAEGALWVQDFNSVAILADTSAIKAAVETLDNAISGSEMQVDVVAALPAGDNNIGNVDILSVLPGTAAGSLGKAEDAAHTTGDTGVLGLAVRLDSGASLVDTDGDYAPLQVDSAGALRVTGGGGGTEYSEDIGTPATIVGTASMMERDDVIATLTPAAGDWAAFRCSAEGALWVQDFNSVAILADTSAIKAAVETLDNAISGSEMQVDVVAPLPAGTNAIGKLAANSGTDIGDVDVTSVLPGAAAANLGKAEDAAHTTGDTGVAVLTVRRDTAAVGSDTDGDYSTLNVSATGRLWTSTTIDAALPAGTNEIGKLAPNSGVDIGDVDVTSQPARIHTTDNMGVLANVSTVVDGTTALTVKRARIATSASGDTAIVGAVSAKLIRVLALGLFCEAAVNVRFHDGTADIFASAAELLKLDNTGAVGAVGFVLPYNPVGWFETDAVNRPINLNLSGALGVCGMLIYVEV